MKKQVLYYGMILTLCVLFPSTVLAKMPDDPYFEQWAYEDTGVYDAWNITTGSDDVIVAIIDNGFDTYHPDLRNNIWTNEDEIPRNGIDDDHNGYIDDIHGWNFLDNNNNPRPSSHGLTKGQIKEGIFHHGTLVAGIIGAQGNNHQDGAGLNWDVRLMNLKVLGNSGTGDLSPLVEAIYYAVDNGADIINISMVGNEHIDDMYRAVAYAYEKGIVVVAAAGNNFKDLNSNPVFPICIDTTHKKTIIGVSAISETHQLAIFSNVGSDCIDITAPGVAIQSTLRFSPKDNLPNRYSTDIAWDGTSFAAPFISGAAALVKSVQPSWGASQIFDALISTVHHTPSEDEDVYENLFGSGLLQIDKAVAYAAGKNIDTVPLKKDTKKSESQVLDMVHNVSSRVMYVAPRTGEYEIRHRGKEKTDIKHRFTFAGIEDIVTYINHEGKRQYVALKDADNGMKKVYIYDEQMIFINSWTFDKKGQYSIIVGDIDGDSIPEMLFAPQQKSYDYIYVYTIEGTYISTYHKKEKHEGAIVNLIYNKKDKKYDIVLLFIRENNSYVERLDKDFNIKNNFILKNKLGGEMVVFDIDQDGIDEYIIGAAPGKQAFIYVIGQDGVERYRFRGYPPQMKLGMDMAVIDYGDDGVYELVLTPRVGGTPVRIMSLKGKILESWWPLASQDIGRVFAIPLNSVK